MTDIIGERIVIRFAPEVGIKFTHDVHGLAGPAVHEIIGGEPCLAMVISQVYLDALIPVHFDSIAATPVLFDSIVLHEGGKKLGNTVKHAHFSFFDSFLKSLSGTVRIGTW